MSSRPRILVVGSFVMDLIVSTPRFPGIGETVLGTSYTTAPGGKGANQAIQAARLGAVTAMCGKVGGDDFGRALLQSAQDAGIDTSHVLIDQHASSAVGNIQLEVTQKGTSNRIIVVPGANMTITGEDIAFLRDDIGRYDMVMLQLEIPMWINEKVAAYAYENGVPVMLNSAPSDPLSAELLSHLTYISPNEHEAGDLTGVPVRNPQDAHKAAAVLREKGVPNVIITLGAQGAVMDTDDGFIHRPGVRGVEAVDPTAAGDSFVGAFCVAVCAGASHKDALVFANHAAAITVSRMGAQPSEPTIAEVVSLMRDKHAACGDGGYLETLM